MLSTSEIKSFIDNDKASKLKKQAQVGQKYYEGKHDIKDYTVFYFNNDDEPVVDAYRSNIKIAHPFFIELVDQATQYILSGKDGFIKSDETELQKEMDKYFNNNEDFIAELSETITGCQSKGFEYMYAYKNENDRLAFQCADSLGVVEVEARFASDGKDHTIYSYVDRVDKDDKTITKIQDWDDENIYYYQQVDSGNIEPDNCFNGKNVRPHILYKADKDGAIEYDTFGFVPFFRMDNNKKKKSSIWPVKDLIDDYDLINCGLSNNLVDFDTPLHVIKGYNEDNLDKLQFNVKTKKLIGIDDDGDVDVKTVNIPYEARKVKLQEDEKNIYKFGMGLNTAGLKDLNATTNIAIKAAYSLLDLKCSKLIIKLKQFLKKIVKIVLDEINAVNKTDYTIDDVKMEFKPEIMSNAQENAQIKLSEAQATQVIINTLLSLAAKLDNETLMKNICDALDIDYEKIKSKLPDPNEAETEIDTAQGALDKVPVEESE